MDTHATPNTFQMELTAIGALLDDVSGNRFGHRQPDTLSSLCGTVRQLKQIAGIYLAREAELLSPFSWIRETDVTSDLQLRLSQLSDSQAEMRLLIEEVRSLASRYPDSQRLSPVLRVALWNLQALAFRLNRHLAASNSRLVAAAKHVPSTSTESRAGRSM